MFLEENSFFFFWLYDEEQVYSFLYYTFYGVVYGIVVVLVISLGIRNFCSLCQSNFYFSFLKVFVDRAKSTFHRNRTRMI